MTDAAKSLGLLLLLGGFITIIGGGALVVAAYGATTGGGSTTTTSSSGQTTTSSSGQTTTTAATSSSTTTQTTAPNTQATSFTTSPAGVSASVQIDGGSLLQMPYSTVLSWGTHSVTCGSAAGYKNLNPAATVFQDGAFKSFVCQYSATATPTTSLNVYVEFCSLTLHNCYAQGGANVQITGGATQITDVTGYAQFIVPQNAQYTAVWLNSGYGPISNSVTCASTCPLLTLKATTSGLNVLGINGFTPDEATTVGYGVIVFGFVITSMGAILLRRQ